MVSTGPHEFINQQCVGVRRKSPPRRPGPPPPVKGYGGVRMFYRGRQIALADWNSSDGFSARAGFFDGAGPRYGTGKLDWPILPLWVFRCRKPKLTARQEAEYIRRFKAGDQSAGNVLARRFQRLLLKLCRTHRCLRLGADGLSVALLGFAHALNKFNPSRHLKAGNIAATQRKARRAA